MNPLGLSTQHRAHGAFHAPTHGLRVLGRLRPVTGTAGRDRAFGLGLLILPILVLLNLVTGCKLVQITMPGEPLPKGDFALRGQTRQFALDLCATVEHVADSIADQTNDTAITTHCLQWKIGAVGAIRSAALHASPRLALLDSWAFCRQMQLYLDQGAGSNLFGPYRDLAVTNTQALERRLAQLAHTHLTGSEFSKMDAFLADYVARFPMQTISFDREPVVPLWERAQDKPTGIPPAGTTSEALTDVADRFQMFGEQVPDELRWRLAIERDELQSQWARTGVTLDHLDESIRQIGETAKASPGVMTNAVADLRSAFLPALERFQDQWDNTTRTLETQRQALTETLASERSAVLKAIAQQRVELMNETQGILRDLVDRSLTQARGTIRDVLFYLVLLAAIVLGLPFLFGFLLGRVWGRYRPAKAPQALKPT